LYFTDKESLAEGYTYHRKAWLSKGKSPTIYQTHIKLENPLVIDAGGARNNNIPFPGVEYKRTVFGNLPKNAVSVEKAAVNAFNMGHDGLIVKNVMDGVTSDDKTKSTVFVVKRKEQAKSSELVTKDDAGNVIPLSQRFQSSSADVRFMPAPVPDPSIPGAYSMSGYRILPGKTKGKLRVYSPSGSLVGVVGSVDDAQRMIQRKLR
jgi:hypothetical protein